VWGTIGTSGLPPQSSYTIDNGLPVNFTAAQEAYIQYQVNFFVSSVSPGPHTLVITTSIDGGQYYLDYIQVIPPLPNGNCPVVQASSDSSKGSITSSSSTAASNTFTQLQSESITPSGGKSSISVGGILGITVGCTACAAVMVIVIYHLTIRRRKKKNQTYICEPGFVAVTTPRISRMLFHVFSIWFLLYDEIFISLLHSVDFPAVRRQRNGANALPIRDRK